MLVRHRVILRIGQPLRFAFTDLLILRQRDEEVYSPEFSCFGHQWLVFLYPGGEEDSDDGMVALFLRNMSDEAIKIFSGVAAMCFFPAWGGL